MDREVIEQKLESLRHCLQRIESKCPADAQVLASDPDLQDIVALNLSRAVHVCVDIGAHLISGMRVPPPDTMGQTFGLLAKAGVLRFTRHYGDLTVSTNLIRIIQQVQPDEIYILAAMCHVAVSFATPEYMANADGTQRAHRFH
jgi:hypothetical protein